MSSHIGRNDGKTPVEKGKGGLNVEIHPFLKPIVKLPEISKNPLKRNVRDIYDPTLINPYLEEKGSRRKRQLAFNEPGKYIEQAERIRESLEEQHQEQLYFQQLGQKGYLPDESLREDLYRQEMPPDMEWWDTFYVNGHNYELINDDKNIMLDNETSAISIYIQHPVFLDSPLDNHKPSDQSMYLTKKELKRKRKNERQERFKLQQERIRLGLDPVPAPKVKLSNLMNVLTNEAIKDPTAVEKRVKKEVEQRYKQHMKANEERQLTKEQRHEKIHQKTQEDMAKGIFRSVYKVKTLIDAQHFFKIDKNAQQLELCGLCVVYDDSAMIVVEGGAKSIKFYDKLVMKRIDWTKSSKLDLTNNQVFKIWTGQIKDSAFYKWTVLKPKSLDDLYSILNRFNVENYWREASIIST